MNIWVSGGSSGLGLYTAMALAQAGHTVISGARSFSGDAPLNNLHRLHLDVTDDDSVRAFAESALGISPTVDAVVHCAGIICLGPCEETTPDEYRSILETNFLGMVRMNQAALPHMRRQGNGCIIMFSSINGLLGIPFQSAYTASKHAVEGYAECLQQELQGFGIQVCLVEPGDHRGGAGVYRRHAAAMTETSPYAQDFVQGVKVIRHDEENGSDPLKLGRRIALLLQRRRMPFRLRIASPDQHLAAILHGLLPGSIMNRILRFYYLRR